MQKLENMAELKQLLQAQGPELAPFLISVALYYVLVQRDPQAELWTTVLKCAPIVCLKLYVVLQGFAFPRDRRYSQLVLLGLLFSCGGDALLNIDLFPHGMALFACAQMCYIFAFGFKPLKWQIAVPLYLTGTAFCTFAAGFGIGRGLRKCLRSDTNDFYHNCAKCWLFPFRRKRGGRWFLCLFPSVVALIFEGLDRVLSIGLPIYVALLLTMCWRSLARAVDRKSFLTTFCGIGSVLFVISDGIIAVDMFIAKVPHARIVIMATYYLAQFAIALSTGNEGGKKKKKHNNSDR